MSEHMTKRSFWPWLSLILLATTLFFGYRYMQTARYEAEHESEERISEDPITADSYDPMIELMSSTATTKTFTYRPTSNQSLSYIAKKYKITVTDLKRVNPALKYRSSKYVIRKGYSIKVPVKTTTPPPSVPANSFQKQVLDLTNKERAKAGLKPLKSDDSKLNSCATAKSNDMHDNNYFAHNSPKYGSPFDMMKKFGVSYKSAGENIAMGQQTPTDVVKAWMNSSGHRANILNGSFTHLGVGYKKGAKIYWTQQFISK